MIQAYRLAFTDSIATAFRPRGAAGRWNSKGVIVVYTAEHPALAALEMLTSWDDYEEFSRYHLYRCEIPKDAIYDAIPDIQQHPVEIHVERTHLGPYRYDERLFQLINRAKNRGPTRER